MDETVKQPRTLFKDGRYYMIWWLAIVGGVGSLQMIGEGAALIVAVIDAVFIAIVMWLLFTVAQNLWNKGRGKKASWAIGFIVWMGVKFIFALPRLI